MRNLAFFQFFATLFEKIGDIVFAKKRAEEKKKKAIIITVVCISVVLLVGGIVAAVIIMKKKGIDVSPRGILNRLKGKKNDDELCLGFDDSDCDELDMDFE